MTRVFVFLSVIFLTVNAWAQSPEKMSYQAIIRDNNGQLATEQKVGVQISILQGSTNGTAVYVETQSPTTNTNGLISMEIGTGTAVSGDFAAIDWTGGPYFIKTESDPTGGTNYTITGTSQLLSVPYALHAKTAETVSGEIDETDPLFTTSDAADITSEDITNLGNLSGTNTGDQDLSNLATQSALEDSVSSIQNTIPTYSVGDFAQGGVVFWVDETGQHGLVCAKEDQSDISGISWWNYSTTYTEARGDGIYAGEMNTMLIISIQGNSTDDYAAGICANLVVTEGGKSYGDWYLPSKEELNLMYENRSTIDATAVANGGGTFIYNNGLFYWSSTEYNDVYAWMQAFSTGLQIYDLGKDIDYYVRAIRAF